MIARIAESGTKDLSGGVRMTYQLNGVSTVITTVRWPERIKKSVSASLVSQLPRHWDRQARSLRLAPQ